MMSSCSPSPPSPEEDELAPPATEESRTALPLTMCPPAPTIYRNIGMEESPSRRDRSGSTASSKGEGLGITEGTLPRADAPLTPTPQRPELPLSSVAPASPVGSAAGGTGSADKEDGPSSTRTAAGCQDPGSTPVGPDEGDGGVLSDGNACRPSRGRSAEVQDDGLETYLALSEEGSGGSREDEEDDFVRVEPEMHRGHVEVRVLKEGWLQKQCLRVVDGRPSMWRHFAFWKQRYFVLGSDGVLRYYKDAERQHFRRAIPLAGMEVTAHFYAPADPGEGGETGGLSAWEGEGTSLSVPVLAAAVGSAEAGEKGGKCLIIRPKQVPFPSRRRASSTGGQTEGASVEEEMKLLAASKAEMQEWLGALRRELEATERQGQTLFNTAWSLLRSYIDRPQGEVRTPGGGEEVGRGARGIREADVDPPPADLQHRSSPLSPSSGLPMSGSESAAPMADVSFVPPSVPIPRMKVVMMVVGTRGDVQPFVTLGLALRAQGHRVRLATHAMYRPLVVEEAGLEFYPLGGDPLKLSAYMVKTAGRVFPFKLPDHQEMTKDVPEQRAMLSEIILSTWPACTAPDPEDPLKRGFRADAIISNPPVYGHVHCAEALNVPLHIMFPQPWSPTKAFPHPLSGLPYHGHWCKENYYSYLVVDKFLWLGIQDIVNELRVARLGLPPLRLGEHGGDLLNRYRVPFAKMWSPCLVPKPKDWGPHIDVVGHFFGPQTTGTPPGAEALQAWLEPAAPGLPAPPAPIFVGFGSMVIPDARSLVAMILEAAHLTDTRVVLQSSWTELPLPPAAVALPSAAPSTPTVFSIGNCPHDWLLKRCCAVIHHGGAGTVAAGLRAGKPTMVCPFFGDQFFWGQMVFQARVGLPPVPVVELTAEKLATAFKDLRSPSLVSAAERMAERLGRENGAKEGLKAFYRHLPVEDMVCDVSLFTDTPRLARAFCTTCGLKLSSEAHAALHCAGPGADTESGGDGPAHADHDVRAYSAVDWASLSGPKDATEGLVQGLSSLTHEFLGSMAGVVTEPVAGAHKTGVRGAAQGLASGLVNLVRRPIRGGIIFVDKVTTGVSNQLQLQQSSHGVGIASSLSPSFSSLGAQGEGKGQDNEAGSWQDNLSISYELMTDLRAAHAQALQCKALFMRLSKGDPRCVPKEGVLNLLEEVRTDFRECDIPDESGRYSLFGVCGAQEEAEERRVLSRALLERIDAVGAGQISFQQFCVFFKALRRGALMQLSTREPGTVPIASEATAERRHAPAVALTETPEPTTMEGVPGEDNPPSVAVAMVGGPTAEGEDCKKSQLLDSLVFDSIFLEERSSAPLPQPSSNCLRLSLDCDQVELGENCEERSGTERKEHDQVPDDDGGSGASSASSGIMEDVEIQVDVLRRDNESSKSGDADYLGEEEDKGPKACP